MDQRGTYKLAHGGGSHEFRDSDGTRMMLQPGDTVSAYPWELGDAIDRFDVVEAPKGNLFSMISGEGPTTPIGPVVTFHVRNRPGAKGWFDVVSVEKDGDREVVRVVSDRPLRNEEARELAESLPLVGGHHSGDDLDDDEQDAEAAGRSAEVADDGDPEA